MVCNNMGNECEDGGRYNFFLEGEFLFNPSFQPFPYMFDEWSISEQFLLEIASNKNNLKNMKWLFFLKKSETNKQKE